MEEAVINTRDVIIAILQGLGMIAVFMTLIFSKEIYKALTEAPKPKLGHGTPFVHPPNP